MNYAACWAALIDFKKHFSPEAWESYCLVKPDQERAADEAAREAGTGRE